MKVLRFFPVLALLLPATSQAQYADAVLTDSPVAYWRMDDADGSRITDSSGNEHHGAVDGENGSISFGRSGLLASETGNGSVSLAGFDRIIIPGFEKIGERGFSAEYWVRVRKYPEACCDSLISDGEGAGDFFMMNYLLGPGQGDDGGIRPHFSVANTPVSLSTAEPDVLALDTVYHVVTTWDAQDPENGNGKIYFNGELVLADDVSGVIPPAGDTGDNMIFIGRDGRENRPSHFDIDEVALYDFPLSEERIKAHFEAAGGPARTPTGYEAVVLNDGPVAYWRMDDADGLRVVDASGGGHDGAVDGETGSVTFGHGSLLAAEPDGKSVSLAGFDRIIVPGFEKIGEGGYSVEYWVRVTKYPEACCDSLVSDGEGGGDFFMMNYLLGPGQGDDGGIRPHFSVANAPVALSTAEPDVLALNVVYHVVTTWDAKDPDNNNGKIYIDGVEVLAANVSGVVPPLGDTGDNTIFIGRDGRENRPSNFDVDEVAMYDYALSTEQVVAHFEAGSGKVVGPGGRVRDANDLRFVPEGMVHYWTFNEAARLEGNGMQTFDRAGSADGTFEGNVVFEEVDTAVGGSLLAVDNSAGSGVNVGAEGFDDTAAGFTVEALIFPFWSGESGDYDEIFRKEDGGNRILFGFQNDAFGASANPAVDPGPVLSFGLNVGGYGELDMPLEGDEAPVTLESLKDGRFHHVAATYDTETGEKAIWVDGEKAWSVMLEAGTAPVTGGGAPAYIGNTLGGSGPFTGGIDEVAIWNRALTAEEIAKHVANVEKGNRSPYILPPDVSMSDYANAVLEDAPVAYWRLGDVSGAIGEAVDVTGNNHTGIVEEGTLEFFAESLVPPDGDSSVSMKGDRFLVEGFDKIDTGFTVEFWVQINAATGGYANLVGDGDGGANFMLMVYMTPGGNVRPHVQTDTGYGALDTIRRIDDGILHHIVSTWDEESGEMILYIDGQPAETRVNQGSFPTTGGAINTENPIFIGRDNREPGWDGLIDEVAIYDYALSPERVKAHFDLVDTPAPLPDEILPDPGNYANSPEGLTHVYDFNEANRKRDGFSLDFAYDRSGAADGTFEGGAGRTGGLLGRGAATFDNATGAAVNLGAEGFETSTGITLAAVILLEWSGNGDDYDEIFRKEDGGNRILFSFQNDAYNGGANPPVDPGPVLSFGLNAGGYGELDMPLSGADAPVTLEVLKDGNPHLVVATYDSASGEKAIWVDGEKAWRVMLEAGTEIVSGGGAAATIGNVGPGGSEPFTGVIDEFGFWNRAVSAEEIAEFYEAVRRGRSNPYLPKPSLEGGYAVQVLQDHPVGYWRLDDAGPTAADSSGNGNDGAGELVEWGADSLLAFDANASANVNGEGIVVPEFEKIGPNGFTVEFIMQIDEGELGGFKNLVGDGVGGLNFMLMVYLTGDGNLRSHVNTTSGLFSKDSIQSYADGTAHHVASAWNAKTGELVLYVDGEAVETTESHGSFPTAGEAINTGNPLYIGRDGREGGFIGLLDEVAIYDYPLSAERIAVHYTASVTEAPVDPGPGDGREFAVTEASFDVVGKEVNLTWNSTEGTVYIIETSTDLENWREAIKDIASGGEVTSIGEPIGAFLPADATRAFVRVKISP